MGDVTYALLKLYLIFAGLVDSQIYQVKGWGIRAVYGDCHKGNGRANVDTKFTGTGEESSETNL